MSAHALEEIARKAFVAPFGAVLELRPHDGAPAFIDGRGDAPRFCADLPDDCARADCVWRCAPDILARVLTSKRAVESAVINGRLEISGDMSVMARLHLFAE